MTHSQKINLIDYELKIIVDCMMVMSEGVTVRLKKHLKGKKDAELVVERMQNLIAKSLGVHVYERNAMRLRKS